MPLCMYVWHKMEYLLIIIVRLINEYKRCSDIDVMIELKNPTVPSSTMTAPFGSLALDDTLI